MGLIYDKIVTVSTTQEDITGLTISKDKKYLLVCTLLGNSDYYLYANDNTTGYNNQNLTANSATVSGVRSANATFASASTKCLVNCDVNLPNSGQFSFQSNVTKEYGGSSVQLLKYNGGDDTVNTSITKLSIVSATANQILIDSRIQLYELN